MRQRVSVIIIKNKKLLLVKGIQDFYFTPGGGVEKGESLINAIMRECDEELGIMPVNPIHYLTYRAVIQNSSNMQRVHCYLAKGMEGKMRVKNEIEEAFWYGIENYKSNSPKIADSIYVNLIPKLVQEDLM